MIATPANHRPRRPHEPTPSIAPARRPGSTTAATVARSSRGALGALLLVGVLLISSGLSLIGAAPSARLYVDMTHVSAAPIQRSLVEQARASAALGQGPGSVPAPAGSHPSSGPNLSFGVVMTFDAHDGYVVAVSLNDSAGPYSNNYGPTEVTWKFSGGNWSVLNTTGQVPATLSPGLVYDARDAYVLLYGGRLMNVGLPAPVTNQTWAYQAGTWTNLSNSSTPAPYAVDFPNLVYDATDEYVLLYDEVGMLAVSLSETLETTWSYAGGIWTNLTGTAGTPPAFYGQLAYDAVDHYVVYFGGYTLANQLVNSTFTFAGGVWTNATGSVHGAPAALIDYAMDYDASRGQVLLYGGIDQAPEVNSSAFTTDTWGYVGGNWTLVSTNSTAYNVQSMVYDAADNETLLMGSTNFTNYTTVVTWVFSNGSWTIGAPAFAPSARATDTGHGLTLDVTQSPNGGALTYRYSGLPAGCASVNAPTLRCVPSEAGTFPIRVSISGSGGFDASAHTTIIVGLPPVVLRFVPSVATGEVGLAIGFAVNATAGSGDLTYSYAGLPPGCQPANAAQLTCTPTLAGSYDVVANVSDSVGVSVIASTHLEVVAALALVGVGSNRTVLDVGEAVSLATVLAGGLGPYTYLYSGLPGGCTAVFVATFSCVPTAVGPYTVGLQSTDALGATVRGSAALMVNARPSVGALEVSNHSILPGGSVVLSIVVSGGTAPFAYVYSGLPGGCSGVSTGTVACASVRAGNYTVSVTVTDATGATATTTGVFSAVAPRNVPINPHGSAESPLSNVAFWWGFGLAGVAIAIAAVAGGYRLRVAREGREILRELEAGPRAGSNTPTIDSAANSEEGGSQR